MTPDATRRGARPGVSPPTALVLPVPLRCLVQEPPLFRREAGDPLVADLVEDPVELVEEAHVVDTTLGLGRLRGRRRRARAAAASTAGHDSEVPALAAGHRAADAGHHPAAPVTALPGKAQIEVSAREPAQVREVGHAVARAAH